MIKKLDDEKNHYCDHVDGTAIVIAIDWSRFGYCMYCQKRLQLSQIAEKHHYLFKSDKRIIRP